MSIATVTTLVSSLMASFLLSIHLGTIKMEIEWTDEPAKKSSQPFKRKDSNQPKDTGPKYSEREVREYENRIDEAIRRQEPGRRKVLEYQRDSVFLDEDGEPVIAS
jgi:hypothetical protein